MRYTSSAGNFLIFFLPREPLLCDSEVPVPRSRIRSALQLRTLLVVVALALAGCNSDGIHSPQKFFPGSERTAWNDCGKFTESGNTIAICASTALLPGATAPSYNIQFAVPSTEHVKIAVFNENAALVKVLFDADEPPTFPGSFRVPPIAWDFTDANGVRVPPGDYRLYFQAGDFVSTSDVEVE